MSDSSRPNILVMISDQQRGDHLGCMGNDILQTPNLDRLAQSGVLCRRTGNELGLVTGQKGRMRASGGPEWLQTKAGKPK